MASAESMSAAAPAPAGVLSGGGRRPRVLYVDGLDRYFVSNRLPMAVAARDAGAEVLVAAGESGYADEIRREGFEFFPLPLARGSTAVGAEANAVAYLARLYRRVRPDLVHHITIKPVLYGSVAARGMGDVRVVNTISGLGYTFTAEDRARLLRVLVKTLYRFALRHPRSRTIFQNPDDRRAFLEMGLVEARRTVLIRGSGVNCSRFRPSPEPGGDPVVLLPARILWDKGVGEFVHAARAIRASGARARFILVGDIDPENPTAVSREQLDAWVSEGVVEWWGFRTDMPRLIASSTLVVLPSYREGVPRVLLEAGASARAVVTTDVPGCREVVRDGVNGLLVPVRDGEALRIAIEALLGSRERRTAIGRAGREIVTQDFREEIITSQTLALYREVLGAAAAWGR